jgi:hypothetical protein
VIGNGSGGDSWNISGSILSDYNLWAPSRASYPEGVHSIVQSSTADIMASPADGDFRLPLTSPAVGKGIDLSDMGNLVTGNAWFNIDFNNVTRPQGTAWDIGAYEFFTGQFSPQNPASPGKK